MTHHLNVKHVKKLKNYNLLVNNIYMKLVTNVKHTLSCSTFISFNWKSLPNNWYPEFPFLVWETTLYICSPFWVGIFIILKKKTTMLTVWCRHARSDWKSTEAFIVMIYYCPWHLRKTHFQTVNFIHILEIPTNNGANSWKIKNWKKE